MPFDASGNFSRVHNWQQDRDNGIRIMADRHDEEDDNFANAFNATMLRTGTTPMSGNLQMAGNKVLDVDAGTLLNPGLTFELDGDTGFYQPGTGQLGVVINGYQRALWTDAGMDVAGSLKVNNIEIGGGTGTIGDNIDIPGYIKAGLNLDIAGGATIGGNVNIGNTAAGDAAALIDFHSRAGGDFESRIVRTAGVNGEFQLQQTGTGTLSIQVANSQFVVATGGQTRFTITPDTGVAWFNNGVSMNSTLFVNGYTVIDDTLQAAGLQIQPNGGGQNGWIGGTGDGASYSTYNSALQIWYGLAFRSFDGNIAGFIDARARTLDMWNGFRHAGNVVWSAGNDGAGSGLDADLLDGLQASAFQGALGFTPVQQSGGANQGGNKVRIGWGNAGQGLLCQVDTVDQGRFALLDSGPGDFRHTISSTGSITANAQVKALQEVISGGPGGTLAGLSTFSRDNGGEQWLFHASGSLLQLWRQDVGTFFRWGTTTCYPSYDGGYNLGAAGNRWNSVWCLSSTMQTSDLREKDWRGGLNATELAVAKELGSKIGIYRWLRDVEKDGDAAKLNCGFAAQQVMEVFAAHGLNALDYAFVNYSEWEETTYFDAAPGNEGHDMVETVVPAGNRYSIMLPDLIAFMLVAHEQRLAALEAL